MNSEIADKRREIDELNGKLRLKREVFDFIRNGEIDKAKKILEENSEILSYFIKFKRENGWGKVVLLLVEGWKINYHVYFENEIVEDLEKLQKDIENKENRLEEYIFLKQQQEFLLLQKIDIDENKMNRRMIEGFTFIIAFGTFFTMLSNMLHLSTLEIIFISFGALIIFKILFRFAKKI